VVLLGFLSFAVVVAVLGLVDVVVVLVGTLETAVAVVLVRGIAVGAVKGRDTVVVVDPLVPHCPPSDLFLE